MPISTLKDLYMPIEEKFPISVQKHDLEESKGERILQGEAQSFPDKVSLIQYFRAGLATGLIRPERPALIEGAKTLTFRELDVLSSRLALAIRAEIGEPDFRNNNPDGDALVGLCVPASPNLVICIFAVLKLGLAYVPFEPTFPKDRIQRIVKNCRPLLIISEANSSTISKFDTVRNLTKVTDLDTLFKHAVSKRGFVESGASAVDMYPGNSDLAETVAVVIYTSGSSGTPKGVRHTHRSIMARLYWEWNEFPFLNTEQSCFKTSLTFVDSIPEILGPLLQGSALHIFGPEITAQPNLLIERIGAAGIRRLYLVPSLLQAILNRVDLARDLASVSFWFSTGESLSKELLSAFFASFPGGRTICNFYGSTEVMDVAFETFTSQEEVNEKVEGIHVPLGRCVFNTIIYILDERMGLCPEGTSGEVYIAGRTIASGYVGSTSNEKWLTNPYTNTSGYDTLFRTGDFGRVERANGVGSLFYDGRTDSQIKIQGMRIDIREIESKLAERTGLIQKVTLLVYHPEKEDQTLVAFILPTDPNVTVSRIELMMKTMLNSCETPEVLLLTKVPYLVNGKVDRQRLLGSYEEKRRAEFKEQ